MLQEGKTGTDPNGVRVIVRGGKIVPLAQADNMAATGRLAPGGPVMNDAPPERVSLVATRDDARKAQWIADQADEFMKYNTKGATTPDGKRAWAGTGGMRSLGLPWNGGSIADLVAGFDVPMSNMKGVTSRVVRKMREAGEGSSSDTDVAFNVEAFPNIRAPGPANAERAAQLRKDAQEKVAYADFADQWFAQNGTLLGADVAWRQRKAGPAPAAPAASGAPRVGEVRRGYRFKGGDPANSASWVRQ
jgi:hypothetical protein